MKIHGKRVDLGFVSANFRTYLKDSFGIDLNENEVFVGCQDESIYILVEFDNILDINQISRDLRKILPGYAVPKKIFQTKIPKNEMGKINKVAIEALLNSTN